jgi:hypothetical protein
MAGPVTGPHTTDLLPVCFEIPRRFLFCHPFSSFLLQR